MTINETISATVCAPGYEGQIEQVEAGRISGWVRATTDDTPLLIRVRVNGYFVGSVVASQDRDTVSTIGDGNRGHGFSIAFAASELASASELVSWEVAVEAVNNSVTILSRTMTPPHETTPAPMIRILGAIEDYRDGAISGWIKKPGSKDPVSVDVFVNGTQIASGIEASLFRYDLFEVGHGNGNHGFRIPVTVPVDRAENTLTFEVRPSDAESTAITRAFPRSDQAMSFGKLHAASHRNFGHFSRTGRIGRISASIERMIRRLQRAVITRRRRMGVLGNIEHYGKVGIIGWIKIAAEDRPVIIDVLVDGRVVAQRVAADLFRDDLLAAGIGDGNHAFRVSFNEVQAEAASETRHAVIELRRSGTPGTLIRQRIDFGSEAASDGDVSGFVGRIDRVGDGKVVGWIKATDSNASLRMNVVINGELIARDILADTPREDVSRAGYGTGRYGFSVPLRSTAHANSSEVVVELRASNDNRLMLTSVAARPGGPMEPGQIAAPGEPNANTRDYDSGQEYDVRLDSPKNNTLRGWAVDTRHPGRVFGVEVLVNGYPIMTVLNDRLRSDLAKLGKSEGLGGISVELPFDALGKGEHQVGLRTPDGQVAVARITSEGLATRVPLPNETADAVRVAVIIPVYNAADDLRVCIERLAAFTPTSVDILFINDGSPDPTIGEILREAETRHANMRVLHNENNLGFSGTINRGIRETGTSDVILLNSDARVTPHWIEGMWSAAYSDARIGTATAMSDRAGAFSAPRAGNDNELPSGIDEISFARAFRRASQGIYPRVPTGNGFCMFVRRACLDSVGLLDQAAFPKGYGEENDFCMRAMRAGWRHVIDDRTYVFHDRSKSFGDSKDDLMAAGRKIVNERYPEYTQAISVFHKSPEIALARMTAHRALEALQAGKTTQTRVLFVVSTQTGGTPQTNADLMRAFDGSIEGWLLRCDSQMLELSRLDDDKFVTVAQHKLKEPVDALTHTSSDYDRVVQAWILAHDFDLVHVRHIAWHSLNLPAIAKRLNRRVVFSFHDYYMITPTIKMIDDAGVFLGDDFGPEGRSWRESLWPEGSQPDPAGPWLAYWRSRSDEALIHCDAFITTSESARDLILKHLPSLPRERFLVIPHGRDFNTFDRMCEPVLSQEKTLRILVPGNINTAKGLKVILALLDHDVGGRLEFHILGNIDLRTHPGHPRLVLHGRYTREEFARRVSDLKVHAGAVLSIWDETYCHTLTEMWSVGLPVLVLDMPNVADRVRRSGGGWVASFSDIPALYDTILAKVGDPADQAEKVMAIADWQAGYGSANSTRMMASHYLAIYRDVLRSPWRVPGTGTLARVAVVCPAHRSLREAYASTYVRVWERCHNDIERDVTFIRMSPRAALAAGELGMIDAAIIQRTALPQPMISTVLDTFGKADIPYVFEIDDDLLNVPKEKDPDGVYSDYAPGLRRLLAQAKVVTVSTEPLRETFAPLTQRVELLPNQLSARLWKPAPSTLRGPGDLIHGLYMGTATHDDDLKMILPALEAVAASDERFRCSLIGVSADPELFSGRDAWLKRIVIPVAAKSYDRFVPWLLRQASQFDFALAPLQDTSFNAAKSPLKLYDYAGMGLPVLASDVAVYSSLARTCPQARLVSNSVEAWQNALMDQIRLGQRSAAVDQEQHAWLRAGGMLTESLPSFDAMLLGLVGSDRGSHHRNG